jgi:hypothetical protein
LGAYRIFVDAGLDDAMHKHLVVTMRGVIMSPLSRQRQCSHPYETFDTDAHCAAEQRRSNGQVGAS